MIAETETTAKKLTQLEKEYDEEFSSSKASPSVEILSKDELNNEDNDIWNVHHGSILVLKRTHCILQKKIISRFNLILISLVFSL